MQTLLAQQGKHVEEQLRQRIIEIDRSIERLQRERETVEKRLRILQQTRPAPTKTAAKASPVAVSCPKCGRDRDFLTDAGGYLAHVLEDSTDTDLLESGKPLFCPGCGEVFLFQKAAAPAKRRR